MTYTRSKPKRRALPEALPREVIEYDIPESEKIWQELGVELARNTVCGWIIKAYERCLPRRPFAELVKLAKTTGKAHQAFAYFQKLYAIEKIAREGTYSSD